jgi:hypothetical protein
MWKYLGTCLILVCISGCSANEVTAHVEDKFGVISSEDLLSQYPEFAAEFQAYQASEQEISAIRKIRGKSLLVLFGTWCHDSEREVPRLLKLLAQSQVQVGELKLVGLNYHKQDDEGLHRRFKVRYTPTIILLDGEKELGRIVEKPIVSLSEDLAAM